jgi:hypothetical protein
VDQAANLAASSSQPDIAIPATVQSARFQMSAALALLLLFSPVSVALDDAQGRSYVLSRAALVANFRSQRHAAANARAQLSPTVALLQQRSAPGDADAVAKTLQSLDVNQNGKIDASEISAFAQSQGLDAAAATSELTALDVDGDGALSAQELVGLLGSGIGSGQEDKLAAGTPTAVASAPGKRPAAPTQHQVQTSPSLGGLNDPDVADVGVITSAPAATSANSRSNALVGLGLGSGGRSTAQSAADTIVKQLALESREQEQAQVLEHRAAELRANSTALSRRMIQSAMAAGSKAAAQKAQEVLTSLLSLETEETRKEVAAAALRAKAKAELREAQELMSIADTALKQASPHAVV